MTKAVKVFCVFGSNANVYWGFERIFRFSHE